MEKVIDYSSHTLLPAQRRYCTTRKELLAVVKFCRHYRHYLHGRKFLIRTDHGSLTWLTHFKNLEGQLARWLEDLQQYDMQILHRVGKKHCNVDALSRIPDNDEICSSWFTANVSPDLLLVRLPLLSAGTSALGTFSGRRRC